MTDPKQTPAPDTVKTPPVVPPQQPQTQAQVQQPTGERGGPEGPEPTRFGDWEKGGRCSDF